VNKKLLVIPFMILGGLMSRWHGGGFKGGVSKTLKNGLWALPFGITLCYFNWWLGVLAFALGFLKAVAHGRGLGLDEPMREDMKPEKVEYLIRWLEPSLTVHAYKHAILSLAGLVAVLGGVIPFLFINPIAAIIIAIGGLLKGVAYEIGLVMVKKYNIKLGKDFKEPTQWGEFITGIFAYGGLAVGIIITL
jgi:hypothetical protein